MMLYKEEQANNRLTIKWPIKIIILSWMAAALFFYLLLAGPDQFWLLAEKLGVWSPLKYLWLKLQPYFHQTYEILLIQ